MGTITFFFMSLTIEAFAPYTVVETAPEGLIVVGTGALIALGVNDPYLSPIFYFAYVIVAAYKASKGDITDL